MNYRENNFLKFFTQRVIFALCGPYHLPCASISSEIIQNGRLFGPIERSMFSTTQASKGGILYQYIFQGQHMHTLFFKY